MSISTPYKILAALLLLLGAAATGFFYGKGQREVVTRTVEVEKEKRVEVQVKGDTETVFRDRIVTVTRIVKPDGTVKEETKTEEKAEEKHETVTENVATKESTTEKHEAVQINPGPLSQWSLGIAYALPLPWEEKSAYRNWTMERTEIRIGRRILGPSWLELGYTGRKEITLGMRIEL